MSRRTLRSVQAVAALLVVLTMWGLGHGRYPLWVDLMVYAVTALAVASVIESIASRNAPGRTVPQDNGRPE